MRKTRGIIMESPTEAEGEGEREREQGCQDETSERANERANEPTDKLTTEDGGCAFADWLPCGRGNWRRLDQPTNQPTDRQTRELTDSAPACASVSQLSAPSAVGG